VVFVFLTGAFVGIFSPCY